jgi:hypothetical protein
MIAFYIALVLGTAIAAAYLTLGYREFQRTRRTYDQIESVEDETEVFADQEGKFTWVALGGVVVSTGLLVLASISGQAWYLLPFLSLGTALAVVVAFIVDGERREA